MTRRYCKECKYPSSVCMCSHITKIHLDCQIYIVQFPKEINHAKNTVRLAKLVCPTINIISSDDKNGIDNLEVNTIRKQTLLIFPNENSEPIESHFETLDKVQDFSFVFLDGTWRQAFRIWKENPFLQSLPSVHFNQAPSSAYQIRRAKA